MERTIVGFHSDDVGDQVAELSCGHRQHVRHEPPFRMRPWVVDAVERDNRIGTTIECRLCDDPQTEGGEPPCLVGSICERCGAVVDDAPHREGCDRATEGG